MINTVTASDFYSKTFFMTQLLNKTVAAIVIGNHKTAPVFEKYGIDFCCKGKQSLQTACAEKNIDATALIEELEHIQVNPNDLSAFNRMSLSALIDHIVSVHHHYVRNNLQPILNYLLKINLKHGERYPYIKDVLAYMLQIRLELENHMQQEEEVVFPMINEMEKTKKAEDRTALKSLIATMEDEHSSAGSLMEKIRTITGNYNVPDNACTTFRLTMHLLEEFESDLHRHVHLENHILFPKAINI